MASETGSFLARHEFLLRRLHSLSGVAPVGAYMVVHLLTNASLLNGPGAFQSNVYLIHSLDKALPIVEWTFIFVPLLFHAILGVVIIRGGLPNSGTYSYTSNVRYTLQRATGMIAFAFIVWHVFHMHGWFHFETWLDNVARPLFGAQFAPFNASSTGAAAMQASWIVPVLYGIGVLSCIFHLANGVWTFGITWGLWTTPEAQRKANWLAGGVGAVLVLVGMTALFAFSTADVDEARRIENKMYEAKLESGEVQPTPHKRADHEEADPDAAAHLLP